METDSYLVILRDFIEDEEEVLEQVAVGRGKSVNMTEMTQD